MVGPSVDHVGPSPHFLVLSKEHVMLYGVDLSLLIVGGLGSTGEAIGVRTVGHFHLCSSDNSAGVVDGTQT